MNQHTTFLPKIIKELEKQKGREQDGDMAHRDRWM